MSAKHHKRTRAEILAKRANVLKGVNVVLVPKGLKIVNGKVIHANPHVCGAKERERAMRSYMQPSFRRYGPWPDPIHSRSAPVLHITSKRNYYDLAF